MVIDRSHGARFADEDVVRCYGLRPPYPQSLFDMILSRVPARRALLDLGTGPGKVIGPLAPHFASAVAVDPSREMLRFARDAWRALTNISWVEATAEEAALTQSFDLITAGAAIHWMDHAKLFPKLARHLTDQGRVAVLGGDHARNAPWQSEWQTFMAEWSARMGVSYEPEDRRRDHYAYEAWMNIEAKREFLHTFSQTVANHVECQHSRSIWPRRILGAEYAGAFDRQLHDLLAPYAQDGILSFNVVTTLALGRPA